ncbi:hypothetical protein OXPF_07580 [Oxobacter pfennigii]|uniref:Uncharacterized protein n=1 Tax=Oxobacter pfennigii TaxID=36849 RepID=A0A0P8WCA7_9CLOT|nr:DUF5698 domain-containing protein [Oxobacter pfennigii]KPU45525.1 hypothetical protein OXPF_07580 [Oxobacter pfennigii]
MFYLLIFCAKVFEVSLMTLRSVLVNRGEKVYGALIGIVEISIWIVVASTVLTGVEEDPFKMVVYALGFAVGIYLGSTIEEKLAIGLVTIQVIVSNDEEEQLSNTLREQGIGVTVLCGQGLKEEKKILILHIQRKMKNSVIKQITKTIPGAVISASDLKTVHGGYGLIKK